MVAPSHHVKILPNIPMPDRLALREGGSQLKYAPETPPSALMRFYCDHFTMSPGSIPSSAAHPPANSSTAVTGPLDSTPSGESGLVVAAMAAIRPSARMRRLSRALMVVF